MCLQRHPAAAYLFLVRSHDALSDCVGFAVRVGQLLPLIDIPSDTHRYSDGLRELLDTKRGSTGEIPSTTRMCTDGRLELIPLPRPSSFHRD